MDTGVPGPTSLERRAEDRRSRRTWVWRERRTGFDRRHRSTSRVGSAWQGTLVFLRDNPLALVLLLALANLLSILDLAFTLRALEQGAIEVNPLMRTLIADDPAQAVVVKIGLVAGVSVLVYLLRRYRSMLSVALLTLGLFAAIVAYHLFGALFLI